MSLEITAFVSGIVMGLCCGLIFMNFTMRHMDRRYLQQFDDLLEKFAILMREK